MRTFMKATPGALLTGLALLLGSWISGEAMAAGPDDPGFRKCVRCHDETSEHPVLNILLTKHGMVADSRTPMADEACTTCHGPSAAGGCRRGVRFQCACCARRTPAFPTSNASLATTASN